MLQPDIVRPVEELSNVLILEPQYRLTKGLTAKKLNHAIAGAIDEIEGAFAALTDTTMRQFNAEHYTNPHSVAWVYDDSIDIPTTTATDTAVSSTAASSARDAALAHIAHDIAAATTAAPDSSNNVNSDKWPG
jgi:hypothetical protein